MPQKSPIPTTTTALFEDQQIRRERHQEEWFFNIIDIVAILTNQSDYKKTKSY